MNSAVLLSPTDVNTIRRYVHTKYAPLPGNRRAEIVAEAIRRTLQQRLPNIPEQLKNQMVDKLISRCLVGEQREVKPDDVLDLCVELNVEQTNIQEQLLDPIMNWINERSPGRWSVEQVATLLDRSKDHSLALIQQPLTAAVTADQVKGRSWEQTEWLRRAYGQLRKWSAPIPVWVLLSLIVMSAVGITMVVNRPTAPTIEAEVIPPPVVQPIVVQRDIGMPEWLQYQEIDVTALKTYLNSRDSILVEEPYFQAIIDTAQEYDIHPLLLFAITGQEQGFVPKSSKDAKTIANNPFNVGHSWMEYNTDIHNSVGIASRLIVKLADSRPEGHDPFTWFNKTYAEDPKWSDGVRKIFNKLTGLSSAPQ